MSMRDLLNMAKRFSYVLRNGQVVHVALT